MHNNSDYNPKCQFKGPIISESAAPPLIFITAGLNCFKAANEEETDDNDDDCNLFIYI